MAEELEFKFIRQIVHQILEQPFAHDWTLQCFGMLRTYFGDEVRLQLWDHDFQIPGSNSIHDHPWDFYSMIVSGELCNQRFVRVPEEKSSIVVPMSAGDPADYNQWLIEPGTEGKVLGHGVPVKLVPLESEYYTTGEMYDQTATELHRTDYVDGTVTLIQRERVQANDQAFSIMEAGQPWNIVQVRKAEPDEVRAFCKKALARWDG